MRRLFIGGVALTIAVATAGAQAQECTIEPQPEAEGAAEVVLDAAAANAVYDCLKPAMAETYAASEVEAAAAYQDWPRFATAPYPSATHGNRYVVNYAAPDVAEQYGRFEEAGPMPAGAQLAKSSFEPKPGGSVSIGPLFLMDKLGEGEAPEIGDWRYTLVQPDGKVNVSDGIQTFCSECHMASSEVDSMTFLPEEYRQTPTP